MEATDTIDRVSDPHTTNRAWLRDLGGRFVVFEGPDGSGKSTQYARFTEACKGAGVTVCEVREPGGTPIGEHVREILLDPAHTEMSLRCEMMLYMASRAQLIEQTVRPALERGEFVLADRFVSSTVAYQGYGGGLPLEDIERVALAAIGPRNGRSTGGCWPDLTVVFDVDDATASTRVSPERDRMELKDDPYRARVREGYLAQALGEPERFLVIDARPSVDDVTEAMFDSIASHPAFSSA